MNRDEFALSLPFAEEILPAVIQQIGYPSPKELTDEIRTEIERAVEQGLSKSRPACLYKITPLVRLDKGLIAGRDVEIRSVRWAHLVKSLGEPEVLCCFVVTSGPELEEAINEAQKGSLFHAYLLDSVGSVLTEGLADQLEQHVSALLGTKGYRTTVRFSPGYCDWELREGQDALFRFLKPESVGVTRTSAGMMIPQKSISAVLVGARRVPLRSPCRFCPKDDCPYRRQDRDAAPCGPTAGNRFPPTQE
jgi:Vitamin B12 dependent methionine synthase, activation domain